MIKIEISGFKVSDPLFLASFNFTNLNSKLYPIIPETIEVCQNLAKAAIFFKKLYVLQIFCLFSINLPVFIVLSEQASLKRLKLKQLGKFKLLFIQV